MLKNIKLIFLFFFFLTIEVIAGYLYFALIKKTKKIINNDQLSLTLDNKKKKIIKEQIQQIRK